jgi:hypothetical protein
MNFKDLDLSTIVGAEITFADNIHAKEQYPEPGMRAIVLSASLVGIERENDAAVIRIEVDFEPFDIRNRLLETALYPSKAGSDYPPLRAREAGRYQTKQYLFFDEDEIVEDFVLV